MSASVLTADAARAAKVNLVEGKQGRQALNDVLVAYRANRRSGTASTKNRSEVSGSGKKLWRQKGTGNARMGSRRSPIWSGGGVVFGPRPRDWSKKTPKNVKRLAFRTALTAQIEAGTIHVTDGFSVADGKTKSFVAQLNSLVSAVTVLIIGADFDDKTFLAARNVPYAQLVLAKDVNAEDLLRYRAVVVTEAALEILAGRTA